MFLYKKTIDRSALREGFTIPTEYHPLLHSLYGGIIKHGETRQIKIILNGQEYDAQLKNQAFDTNKFIGHTDVIQIRYSVNSPLAKKLRDIFQSSWNYVEKIKALPGNGTTKNLLSLSLKNYKSSWLSIQRKCMMYSWLSVSYVVKELQLSLT